MRYLLFFLIALLLPTNIFAVRKYGLNGAKSDHEKAQIQLMEIFNNIHEQTTSISWNDLITDYKCKGTFTVKNIKKTKEWYIVQQKNKIVVTLENKKLQIAKYGHRALENQNKLPLKFWIGQLLINNQNISSMLWVETGIDSGIEIQELQLNDLEFLSVFMTKQTANSLGWQK